MKKVEGYRIFPENPCDLFLMCRGQEWCFTLLSSSLKHSRGGRRLGEARRPLVAPHRDDSGSNLQELLGDARPDPRGTPDACHKISMAGEEGTGTVAPQGLPAPHPQKAAY